MFNNQNQTPSKDSDNKNLNLSQAKDFSIDDIPIYTMKEDLEYLKNPEKRKIQEIQPEITREELSPKQKTSPFIAPKIETPDHIIIQTPKATPENNIVKISASVAPTAPVEEKISFQKIKERTTSIEPAIAPKTMPISIEEPKSSNILFALNFLIAIMVISLISAGYYYWTVNKTANEIAENEVVLTPAEEKQEEEIPKLSYSTDKPNYMQLELGEMNSAKLKAELEKFMNTIKREEYTTAVEFIITDSNNKKITFNEFTMRFGLTLSPAITSNLTEDFSLYIFNDTETKLGISVGTKDGSILQKAMLDEETQLADELSPFFFTTNYKTDKLFAGSEYKGAKIRFQNIIAPEVLSVDYAIHKNNLLIGTTKMTMRSIIDSIEKSTTAEQKIEAPTNSETSPTTPTNPIIQTAPVEPVK